MEQNMRIFSIRPIDTIDNILLNSIGYHLDSIGRPATEGMWVFERLMVNKYTDDNPLENFISVDNLIN